MEIADFLNDAIKALWKRWSYLLTKLKLNSNLKGFQQGGELNKNR